jgi:hypothetical protein
MGDAGGRGGQGHEDFRAQHRREVEQQARDPEAFPEFTHFPASMLFTCMPVPSGPQPAPEYVYVPDPQLGRDMDALAYHGAISEWNLLWEAGVLRHDIAELHPRVQFLKNYAGRNIMLLPRDEVNYMACEPLYHLLSKPVLDRFGLPLVSRGAFPPSASRLTEFPADTPQRLARAFAHHVWPLLCSGSPLTAFERDESIRLLAHNLDYWIPYAHEFVHEQLLGLPRFPVEKLEPAQRRQMKRLKKDVPPGVAVETPRRGGILWLGRDEAWEATRAIVDLADERGKLRAMIDAIRSHRVVDDFSSRWSHAKEDFERRLYRKRAKTRVTFVEIDETIPCHGPEAEVDADLLWEDFFAVLNAKERQIVVCLRSGVTQVGEIAKEIGYANHSPVSKKLAAIRRKAALLLGIEDSRN